jgi:dipeptidyl aminopeptidase/acylaminoacyl peptidase
MRLSPDGTKIAFLDHPLRGNDAGGPAMVDLSGRYTSLSPGWASTRGLAWSPDGKEILFSAFRTGVGRELYAISPEGTMRLLLQVPGHMTLNDVSREGAVLFTLENERMRTDFLTPGETVPRDLSWLDWSMPRGMTPDGRELLLEESGVGGGELHSVYLRGTDGSPAIHVGDGQGFDLSPDGQWVVAGIGRSPSVLTLLPAGAGEPKTIPTGAWDVNSARWFPDGTICMIAHEPGHGLRLHRLDPATGKFEPFSEEGLSWHEVMVSPDGRSVAAMGPERTLKIYFTDGAEPRGLPQVTLADRPVGWGADGAALFVFTRGELPARVFQVDHATGERTEWKRLSPLDPAGVEGVTAVRMSADGQAFAYSYMQRLSTLYVLEGLL